MNEHGATRHPARRNGSARPAIRRERTRRWRRATLTELVEAARPYPKTTATGAPRAGDERAWEELVSRLSGAVWGPLYRMRLDDSLRADAALATWERLLGSIGSIRDPERLAGWLATTARHEAIRLLRTRTRLVPVGDLVDLDRLDRPDVGATAIAADPSAGLVAQERAQAVRLATAGLRPEERHLIELRHLSAEPHSYAEIAERLGRPPGWVGPTLRRTLDKLGTDAELGAVA